MQEQEPTTYGESRDFASAFAAWLCDDDALLAQVDRDTMIYHIESEFTADEIYDAETLADLVSENKDPEDVFSKEISPRTRPSMPFVRCWEKEMSMSCCPICPQTSPACILSIMHAVFISANMPCNLPRAFSNLRVVSFVRFLRVVP